jgi:drug/metabolite transporter (DMT)-like permease
MAQTDAALGSAANAGVVDARPIRETSADTDWDRAVGTRDHFAGIVRETLERAGMDALVLVSQNGNYPPWLRLEAWVPSRRDDANARERASFELIVDAKPYHEHSLIHTARLSRGRRNIAVTARPEFTAEHVRQWTLHALGKGGKPSNYTPVADALIALALSFFPFIPRPYSNRVEWRFRNLFSLTGAKVLAIASLILLAFGIRSFAGEFDDPWEIPEYVFLYPIEFVQDAIEYPELLFESIAVLAGFVGLIASIVIAYRRRHLVEVPAQPAVAPRNLGLVDSWHTVVAGLGADAATVVQRIRQRLSETEGMTIECRPESYSYRTPNGYEERERLVVTKGQCIVHVHVYPFGNDVFIGWHAYLNWAKWDETDPVSRRVGDGNVTEFRALRPGFYVPSQFDLIDLSSLSEFVHRRIERELKRLMKEKRIDQEIDFQIIRGDRERALDRSRHSSDALAERRSGIWNRIMGSAAAWQPRSETEVVRSAEPAEPRGDRRERQNAALGLPIFALLGLAVLIPLTMYLSSTLLTSTTVLQSSILSSLISVLYAAIVMRGLARYGRVSSAAAAVSGVVLLVLWVATSFARNVLLTNFFSVLGEPSGASWAVVAYAVSAVLSSTSIFIATALQAPAMRGASAFLVFVIGWVALGGFSFLLVPPLTSALGPLDFSMRNLLGQSIGLVLHLPMFALLGHWLQQGAEPRHR